MLKSSGARHRSCVGACGGAPAATARTAGGRPWAAACSACRKQLLLQLLPIICHSSRYDWLALCTMVRQRPPHTSRLTRPDRGSRLLLLQLGTTNRALECGLKALIIRNVFCLKCLVSLAAPPSAGIYQPCANQQRAYVRCSSSRRCSSSCWRAVPAGCLPDSWSGAAGCAAAAV